MQNHFLTDHITTVEDLNQAFKGIYHDSDFDCQSVHKDFFSKGEGIITQDFFLGNQKLNNIDTINITNFNHYVITLPRQGRFSTRVQNNTIVNSSENAGSIVFPTYKVRYSKPTDYVDDLLIAMNSTVLKDLIERKYGILNNEEKIFHLDYKNEKVKAIYNYIESTLYMVRGFPDIRESLFLKLNIKDIALLMVADLIGELLKKDTLLNEHPEKVLVSRAEEIIDQYCSELNTITEIADKLNTSERNLQKAFQKYRNYTPMQFLRERKLHKAHKLILSKKDTNITVKEIALSVGMFDLNRFGKYYSELFGVLPSAFIKKSLQ